MLMIVGGGLALSVLVLGVLLLISSSHMTMPAKCSPLEDPILESQIRDSTGECFEDDSDVRVDEELKKKDKRCDKEEPDLFRSSVRVEGAPLPSACNVQASPQHLTRREPVAAVVSHRDGWGKAILNPEAVVFDSGQTPPLHAHHAFVCGRTMGGRKRFLSLDASDALTAGDRWHFNETAQVLWAQSYCLCPGCNGTDPGVCEECVPRSPGCDVLPPEYDCWMDVRTRSSGFPIFDTGVRRAFIRCSP